MIFDFYLLLLGLWISCHKLPFEHLTAIVFFMCWILNIHGPSSINKLAVVKLHICFLISTVLLQWIELMGPDKEWLLPTTWMRLFKWQHVLDLESVVHLRIKIWGFHALDSHTASGSPFTCSLTYNIMFCRSWILFLWDPDQGYWEENYWEKR